MESMTSSGQALGRLGPTRWVVMVFGALPLELVQLKIIRNFKGRSEAKLQRILEKSPERVEPRCPIFAQCSGCQYQHLSYEAQLFWKREHVQQAFSRIAKIDVTVEATVPSPKVYHYRTKLTPHPQEPPPRRQRLAWQGGEASVDYSAIGFLEQDWGDARDASGRRWRKVVDVRSCPIATEALNEALPAERTKAKSGRLSGPLLLRDTTEDGVVTDPQQVVTEVLSELGAFSFRAGGFFQNNSSILPAFVQHVLSAAVQDSPEVLVDLYCGVGLFSLSGANHFQRIFGVEVEPVAVNLARRNAAAHGHGHVQFLAADAANGLREVARSLRSEKVVVVVDPPRQGLKEEARRALLTLRPQRMVYVSCDCVGMRGLRQNPQNWRCLDCDVSVIM